MMFLLSPSLELPYLDLGTDAAATDPIFASIIAASTAHRHVLVAKPYDPKGVGTLPGTPLPFLEQPFLDTPDAAYVGATIDVYMASESFITDAADDPADYPVQAALTPAYDIEADLGSPGDRLGPAEIRDGALGIMNADGEFDHLSRASWDGRNIEVRLNVPGIPVKTSPIIFRGVVGSKQHDEAGITLGLRLRMALLDNPPRRQRYAGTGGAEGPPEMAGYLVPLALGYCPECPVHWVNKAAGIMRVAERFTSVLSLKALGLELINTGVDYGDYDGLFNAEVPPGCFATAAPYGLIRAGSNIDVGVRASIIGDPDAGTTAVTIYRWLLLNRVGIGNAINLTDIDDGTFSRINALRPWELGIYVDQDETSASIADKLLRSIGGWWSQSRQGRFTVGLYEMPVGSPSSLGIADIEAQGLSGMVELPAVREIIVNYGPVWSPLSPSEMSESLDAGERTYLGNAYRTYSRPYGSSDRNAGPLTINTLLRNKADAIQLAAVMEKFTECTRMYEVKLRGPAFMHFIGDKRRLVWPRWDLADGRDALVVGVHEKAGEKSRLKLLLPRMQ